MWRYSGGSYHHKIGKPSRVEGKLRQARGRSACPPASASYDGPRGGISTGALYLLPELPLSTGRLGRRCGWSCWISRMVLGG